MSNKEKINYRPISSINLSDDGHDDGSRDDDGHDDGGYDDDGYGDDGYDDDDHEDGGYDDNGRNARHEHLEPQAIAENTCAIPTISNKYKKVSPGVFLEILNAKLQNPEEIDDDLDFILTFLGDLQDSIQLVKQLTDERGNHCFPALYEHHYSRAEYLSKLFKQFRWFDQLKKNPCFDFATIEHNGHHH